MTIYRNDPGKKLNGPKYRVTVRALAYDKHTCRYLSFYIRAFNQKDLLPVVAAVIFTTGEYAKPYAWVEHIQSWAVTANEKQPADSTETIWRANSFRDRLEHLKKDESGRIFRPTSAPVTRTPNGGTRSLFTVYPPEMIPLDKRMMTALDSVATAQNVEKEDASATPIPKPQDETSIDEQRMADLLRRKKDIEKGIPYELSEKPFYFLRGKRIPQVKGTIGRGPGSTPLEDQGPGNQGEEGHQ